MLDLKINFFKSEIVPLKLEETKSQQIANILDYKLTSLPIIYLGLPLHWKKILYSDWNILISKIEKKIRLLEGQVVIHRI